MGYGETSGAGRTVVGGVYHLANGADGKTACGRTHRWNWLTTDQVSAVTCKSCAKVQMSRDVSDALEDQAGTWQAPTVPACERCHEPQTVESSNPGLCRPCFETVALAAGVPCVTCYIANAFTKVSAVMYLDGRPYCAEHQPVPDRRRYNVEACRGESAWVPSPAHCGYTDVRGALDAADRCAELVTDSQWRVVASDGTVVWVVSAPAGASSGPVLRPADLVDGPGRRRYRKHKPSGRSRGRW